MAVLAPLAMGAAAAGLLYLGLKALTGPAKVPLEKGRTYRILATLDWTKIPFATPTVPDRDVYASYLKAMFGGLPDPRSTVLPRGASLLPTPDGLGFGDVDKPFLDTQADAEAFFAGRPSRWVLTGRWLRETTDKLTVPAELLKILPQVEFQILPSGSFAEPGKPLTGTLELEKGRTYAVLIGFDWTKIPGATPTVPDKDAMANYIKMVFGGLDQFGTGAFDATGIATREGLGFKVLSQPMPRDQAETQKFLTGQRSFWVFNTQWLKTTTSKVPDVPEQAKKIFSDANFFLLPVA